MDKYAVVKIGGSQFKVKEGDIINVDKKPEKKGGSVILDQVLLYVDEKKVKIGEPYLKNVKIKATLLEHLKGKKIRVATFKAKSRYRKVKGFRSLLTALKIEKIGISAS